MKVVRFKEIFGEKFESEVEKFRDRKSKNFQIENFEIENFENFLLKLLTFSEILKNRKTEILKMLIISTEIFQKFRSQFF